MLAKQILQAIASLMNSTYVRKFTVMKLFQTKQPTRWQALLCISNPYLESVFEAS